MPQEAIEGNKKGVAYWSSLEDFRKRYLEDTQNNMQKEHPRAFP